MSLNVPYQTYRFKDGELNDSKIHGSVVKPLTNIAHRLLYCCYNVAPVLSVGIFASFFTPLIIHSSPFLPFCLMLVVNLLPTVINIQ